MTIGAEQLDSFAALAEAIGLMRDGELNGAWFTDPVGGTQPTVPGLATMLYDDDQRDALVQFVDEVLGAPAADTVADDDGRLVWVPLVRSTDPAVTVFVVLREAPGVVHVGVGVEHEAVLGAGDDAPRVGMRLHVPVFQVDREGAPAPAGGDGLPDWLLLGRVGGRIELSLDVTLTQQAPTPGQPHLAGAALTVAVPTSPADDLGLSISLRDLQLAGATQPATFELDADRLDELDEQAFALLVGLLQAQADALDPADPTTAPFAALAGMLGLRTGVPDLPALPLADLPTAGVAALVDWVETVLADNDARDAWLGQLAALVGGSAQPARDAVSWRIGDVDVLLGLRVEAGTSGPPVLVPWVELELATRPGADVVAHVDLLRADTGSGAVLAVPDLRAEARFGTEAGGAALLTGDPGVGGLRLGVALTTAGASDARQPAFVLTAHDATLGGRTHALLDLSSPQAALDAASDVVDGALAAALTALGDAGARVSTLLGLTPPAGVDGTDAVALLADPLDTLAGYARDLVADAAAMAEVLGELRALVTGAAVASVPGAGTAADPWLVELAGPVALSVHQATTADGRQHLVLALAVQVQTSVTDDLETAATVRITLVDVVLEPLGATFVTGADASLALRRVDGSPLRLQVGPATVQAADAGVRAAWSAPGGLQVVLDAPGLVLEVDAASSPTSGGGLLRVPVPLPTLDIATGTVDLGGDWDAVEAALAALGSGMGSPPLDAVLALLGWRGPGRAHLRLGDVLADPAAAVAAWVADLVLDCDTVRLALGPVAALLSGFTRTTPFGAGSAASPFRCPVAGDSRAPGLAVWLDPPCAPIRPSTIAADRLSDVPPTPDDLVATLAEAGTQLDDVDDLLVARPGLATGLQLLIDRWAGTDGVAGLPTALPDGVTGVELAGVGYDELCALGELGHLAAEAFSSVPTAVVHVGCEAGWVEGREPGSAFDATSPTPGRLPAAGAGVWFVRLPAPEAAAVLRAGLDPVAAQAALLADVLSARSDPVSVLAYGSAAAAAVLAAHSLAAVDAVGTVGAAWGAVSVEALRSGLGGDAARLLGRLLRADTQPWPAALLALECSPLERARRLVQRSLAVAGTTSLPDAAGQPRRAGLAVRAVFGALGADELAVGLGALVRDGIDARFEAATAAPVDAPQSLHVGVDLPVTDVDLGGLLVGAGVTLEALEVSAPDNDLAVATRRGLVVAVHLGVTDGWLVGGPGAVNPDLQVRWLSARVEVPLDGRDGRTELTLHDARAFSVDRERWVVRVDDLDGAGAEVTEVLPEVRLLLSAVVGRVRTASSVLGDVLDVVGLTRDGGLDPAGLDRLFYDTVPLLRGAVAAAPDAMAAGLRSLAGATGSGSTAVWAVGPAQVAVDLGTGAVAVQVAHPPSTGVPSLGLALTLDASGVDIAVTLGALDAAGAQPAGGIAVLGRAALALDGAVGVDAGLHVAWQAPGGPVREVPLLPVPDPDALVDLLGVLLPAVAVQAVLTGVRRLAARADAAAGDAVDGVLAGLDLLSDPLPNGAMLVRLPVGLVTNPGGWLRHGASGWADDLPGSAVTLLDALAPLVVPDRGDGVTGWPLLQGAVALTVDYAEVAGRLRLAVTVTATEDVAGVSVATSITGGVLVGTATAPEAALDLSLTLDGTGLSGSLTPTPRLSLVRPPSPPIGLVPATGGLGAALATAAEAAIPVLLEAVREHHDDAAAPALLRDVARAVDALAADLDLLVDGTVSAARVDLFAADPAAWTLARLPALAAAGVEALADAIDPAGTVVVASRPTPTSARLAFAAGLALVLDGGSVQGINVSASFDVPDVGRVTLHDLRLSATGVSVSATLGPAMLDAGALRLRPLLEVRAGITAGGLTRLLGLGLALDDLGERSVQVRWALDASPPLLVAVDRTAAGEAVLGEVEAAGRLLALAASTATSVVVDAVGADLPATAVSALQGVLFTDVAASTDVDPVLFVDLLDPAALLDRLQRLAWNLATAADPPSVTIDDVVTVSLAALDVGGGRRRLGAGVSLQPGRRFVVVPGETQVEIEVDAGWVEPAVPAGLSIYVLEGALGAGGQPELEMEPAFSVAGLGVRVLRTSGPLLDLGGLSVAAIAVHTYAEVSADGVGGGVRLVLDGLAFGPAGGGGGNAVANGLLADASSQAGDSARPVISPSLAIQQHPGRPLGVSVRAGDPPGPWWVVLQRQLGPLYLDRVGLDTAETGGTVSRITLLFDGSVSLFGLTAAVDQLSLSWLGGDVFDLDEWAVDLRGLAVAADLSGISLAGGLLKTTDAATGDISYVGMLMGRFTVYGLSVFGGYTDAGGTPSFFVFGAVNGPIGGPPAFFVTGIGGGLGINRGLRVPEDLSRFGEYPFIRALDPAASVPEDPMAALKELSAYFPPQPGTFWFAAGISFTSFALVDGVAVVSVAFGQGLEITLFGLARMALPRPGAALVSIELGLLARFSTIEGVFLIQAQLTDNSWLLYEDVRLTGGFAFAVWWKGPLAGQFVLTLGGYHPDFHRDGYPDVPRLGITWQVTDDIVIKGGSYFALTSEALMAGVDVVVSADFGWAWAKIELGAHGIVYFDPFWFEVLVYARVSAGVEIETFLGDISLSISLGARIRVWGPDFSGEATLEVGPCEFTVGFGSERVVEPKRLSWPEFAAKYLEDAGGGVARALSSITGRGTLPAATGGQTGAPTPDGTPDHPFEVVAEFELTIVSTVPTTSFQVAATSLAATVRSSSGHATGLALSPMGKGGLASPLTVTLAQWDEGTSTWVDRTDALGSLARTVGQEWFPIGAWGPLPLPNLPVTPLPQGDVVSAGNRLMLTAQAQATAVGPLIDYYRVESGRRPLPLQAAGTGRGSMLTTAAPFRAEPPNSATVALAAAAEVLFAPPPAVLPAGVLPTGTRSGVAAAAFAGLRAAPPQFGTLTDGLVRSNRPDATRDDMPDPEPTPPRPLRQPFVAGFVTAGSAVPLRSTGTTVADPRTKRRPAPSTESVHTRLGRSLPVQLGRTAAPAAAEGATLLATGSVPTTGAPGASATLLAGPGGLGAAPEIADLVTGLPVSPSAAPAGSRALRATAATRALRSGELVVLQLPDSALDVDERATARPSLQVTGRARVVAVRGDGAVLADDEPADVAVRVPAGTALLAVQADGDLDVTDGLAGWHHGSQVLRLGSHAALGPGCVLVLDAGPDAGGLGAAVAGDLTARASAVTTRFTRPVTLVAVVLDGAAPERLDALALELTGADLVAGPDGAAADPTVVVLGSTSVLVHAVVPTADTVLVRVRAGGTWAVAGVLGGTADVAPTARLLAERGVAAVAGRLLATSGAGCTLRWRAGRARERALG